MPASRIQAITVSCARRSDSEAYGRVIRPGSSVKAASSSQCAITVSASFISPRELAERNLLCALPQHQMAELAEMLGAFVDGGEMVAGQLACLAGEHARAVREQDLRLADAARVEQEMTWRGVAGVVFVPKVQVELAERDPGRLTAPARLDDLGLQRQHRLELGATLGRESGLEARYEAQPRDLDFDLYARDPIGVAAGWLRLTIWKA